MLKVAAINWLFTRIINSNRDFTYFFFLKSVTAPWDRYDDDTCDDVHFTGDETESEWSM